MPRLEIGRDLLVAHLILARCHEAGLRVSLFDTNILKPVAVSEYELPVAESDSDAARRIVEEVFGAHRPLDGNGGTG